MAYQASKRFLIAKVEGTPGTAEDLAAADLNCWVADPVFTPGIEMDNSLKIATPDSGKYEDIAGAQTGEIAVKVPMTLPSAATTPPNWGKFLRGCGMIGAVEGTTLGYSYTPLQAGEKVTMTMYVVDVDRGGTPVGIAHKIAGAMGDGSINFPGVGKQGYLDLKFKGKYIATADITANNLVALCSIVSIDSGAPITLINALCSIDSVVQKVSSIKLNFGNDVQPEINTNDGTGYDQFAIADRNPTLQYNPLKQTVAAYDSEAKQIAMTGQIITFKLDKTIDCTLKVANGENQSLKDAPREGLVGWDTTVKCMRNGRENSLKVADMDVEAPWELLFGAKS